MPIKIGLFVVFIFITVTLFWLAFMGANMIPVWLGYGLTTYIAISLYSCFIGTVFIGCCIMLHNISLIR